MRHVGTPRITKVCGRVLRSLKTRKIDYETKGPLLINEIIIKKVVTGRTKM